MKGRKPKPPEVHVVNGHPGHRPPKQTNLDLPRGIPPPYGHLSDKVKDAWMEIARDLDARKILSLLHGHALEQAASQLVEVRELREEIEKKGRFQNVRTTNGSKKQVIRPAVLALSDAEKRYKGTMEQFGWSAATESKVTPRKDENENQGDPATKYFKPQLVPPRA